LVAVTVGIRLANGSMPLDTAMLAILLAPEAYWPIRRVGAEFHSAADGAEALGDVMSELDPVTSQKQHAEGNFPAAWKAELSGERVVADRRGGQVAVGVKGISYGYPGAATDVLSNLSLDVPIGLTVVTGPSGAGKSTLLELLAGLRQPSVGTVMRVRSHLVTQRPFLAAGTVNENLTLGNDSTDDELWQALREVGLDGTVAALAQGLHTSLGDDGFGLSAGQRARLALARAALSTAPLLLLDEPTAHLDDQSVALAHQLIQRLAELRTVVVVSHRPEMLTLADRHVHLALRPASNLAKVSS
jgi:ABC-type transport system involved in cytochrome bd biosynthesis fused ATPase/permease subunit